MAKKKQEEEVVQQLDLTELVNYVNYLGEKVAELSQSSKRSDIKFGMDCIETEGQLLGIKYFHTVLSSGACTDVSPEMKEFYAKKYGAIPEVLKTDFYAF